MAAKRSVARAQRITPSDRKGTRRKVWVTNERQSEHRTPCNERGITLGVGFQREKEAGACGIIESSTGRSHPWIVMHVLAY